MMTTTLFTMIEGSPLTSMPSAPDEMLLKRGKRVGIQIGILGFIGMFACFILSMSTGVGGGIFFACLCVVFILIGIKGGDLVLHSSPLPPEKCQEMLRLCRDFPSVEVYRQTVVAQHRAVHCVDLFFAKRFRNGWIIAHPEYRKQEYQQRRDEEKEQCQRLNGIVD